MSPQADFSNWMTNDQVCAALGISSRTLDRMVEAEQLHPGKRPIPGRKPERVFDPDEVRARKPASPARVIPTVAPEVARTAGLPSAGLPSAKLALSAGMIPPEAQNAIIMRLVELVAASHMPPKTYIPLKEASDSTGLSHKFLRRQVKNGNLPAIRDVSIKVHREDLAGMDLTSELVKAPKKKTGRRNA